MEADRRRRFGTVIARKRADGSVGSWLARYASPLDPSRRVQRSFRTSEDAQAWLNSEEMLVNLHRRGVQKWVHPTARSRRARASLMKFDELADWYVDTHRKPDGTALRGAAKRNLKTDVQHLKDVFGGMRLTDITPEVVSKWYFGPHDEGAWVFPPDLSTVEGDSGYRLFGQVRYGYAAVGVESVRVADTAGSGTEVMERAAVDGRAVGGFVRVDAGIRPVERVAGRVGRWHEDR